MIIKPTKNTFYNSRGFKRILSSLSAQFLFVVMYSVHCTTYSKVYFWPGFPFSFNLVFLYLILCYFTVLHINRKVKIIYSTRFYSLIYTRKPTLFLTLYF